MYNNFLCQKQKKDLENKSKHDKRLSKWLEKYRHSVQPHLLDNYHQRVNNFITKIEENPWELEQFQAKDVKKHKQIQNQQKINALSRKGARIFKFRDASDFNSYFNEAQRMERQKNRLLFQNKYGDSDMAYRSIASQSNYNPSLMNEFRKRSKDKQINPPMRYTSKNLPLDWQTKRNTLSAMENRSIRASKQKNNQNQSQFQEITRKNTSINSLLGLQDEIRSVHSIKTQSHRQNIDQKFKRGKFQLKPDRQTFYSQQAKGEKQKRKTSTKSYFIGITDIKQHSADEHVKKTLNNILVKVGKSQPNSRNKNLSSQVQLLSSQNIQGPQKTL